MSGTAGSISASGGLSLPVPRVRLAPNGVASGQHDRAEAGGLTRGEFEPIRDLDPRVWLMRYKRGYAPGGGRMQHSGYGYDNTRGWVHPSTIAEPTAGRSVGGGAHSTRNGLTIPARASEWAITDPHRYTALFEPELWFLNNSTQPYTWPIAPLSTSNGNEHYTLGQSGHSGADTGTTPNASSALFCNSSRTRGTQVQWFAFAIAVRSPEDPRQWIVGPHSEPIKAEIWPRVKISYGSCLPMADRGRKIRLRHK